MEDTAYSVNYYGYRFRELPKVGGWPCTWPRSGVVRPVVVPNDQRRIRLRARDVVEKHTFDKLPMPSAGRAVDERSTLGEWYERHAEGLDQKELDRRVASCSAWLSTVGSSGRRLRRSADRPSGGGRSIRQR